jgi:hypothetical protein
MKYHEWYPKLTPNPLHHIRLIHMIVARVEHDTLSCREIRYGEVQVESALTSYRHSDPTVKAETADATIDHGAGRAPTGIAILKVVGN